MNIYISVVSHGHAELIKEINCLPELAKHCQVVVKCNKPVDSLALNDWCLSNNIHLISESYGIGFGANNNIVYHYCETALDMNEDDYFIVLNPDLSISAEQVLLLTQYMQVDNVKFGAINLFKDPEMTLYDNSVRQFPALKDFIKSFIFRVNDCIIDKSQISTPSKVDWTAGSFMAINSGLYKTLDGFDERYFMYCEDIDICYRSSLSGVPVVYYPHVRAVHLAKHANRSFFSRHFIWHLTSAFRFLVFKFNNKLPKI